MSFFKKQASGIPRGGGSGRIHPCVGDKDLKQTIKLSISQSAFYYHPVLAVLSNVGD